MSHASRATPRIAVRAVDALASASIAFGIPLLILRQSGSVAWAGSSFALAWLPQLIAISTAAPWTDRIGARRAVIATALTRANAVLALLLAGPGTPAAPVLAGLAALCGFLAPVGSVAADTLTAEVGRDAGQLAGRRIAAWQTAVDHTSELLGPLLAAVLVTEGAVPLLCGCAGLSLAAAAAAIRLPRGLAAGPGERARPSLRTGYRILRADPVLAWFTFGGLTMNCLSALVEVATPIRVTKTFHYATAASGVVWAIASAAALASLAVATKAADRHGNWRMAALTMPIAALAATATAIAPTYLTYTAAVAAMLAAEQGGVLVLRTLRQRRIPAHAYASTASLSALLILSPFPLAGLAAAAVGAAGLPTLLLGASVMVAAALALTLRNLHRHRHEIDGEQSARPALTPIPATLTTT